MPETFVIDGYNLIHALGMIQKRLAPGGLQASRRQLLDLLAHAFGASADAVTIVFDAKQAPPGVARQQKYRGLHIHFAPKGQSADDWIETLIAAHRLPTGLVVVSNDARLRNAAHQRKAKAWSDQELLDFMERKIPPPASEAREDARTPEQSTAEKEEWLREFGDLEHDPDLKEFFDYNRFDDE